MPIVTSVSINGLIGGETEGRRSRTGSAQRASSARGSASTLGGRFCITILPCLRQTVWLDLQEASLPQVWQACLRRLLQVRASLHRVLGERGACGQGMCAGARDSPHPALCLADIDKLWIKALEACRCHWTRRDHRVCAAGAQEVHELRRPL